MTCNGLYLGDVTGISMALSYPGIPADIVIKANEYGQNNGYFVKHFNVGTIESETAAGTTLTSKRDELLTKAVTASVEDFDSVYDAGIEDYLNAGGNAIIDERIQLLYKFYNIEFTE